MNTSTEFKYDVVFKTLSGEEGSWENASFFVPAQIGDHILWCSQELVVEKIIHFLDGQKPTLQCKPL